MQHLLGCEDEHEVDTCEDPAIPIATRDLHAMS